MKVDVRILAATNRILEKDVKNGTFREDLFYRLNVVNLAVPPLRDRRSDIAPLANHFLEKFSRKNKRQVHGITPQCMHVLQHYSWPGNVRELENAIERGVILMRGDYLDVDSLPLAVIRQAGQAADQQSHNATPPASLEEAEKMVIANVLNETDGNRSETARRLNITRKTLLAKLRKYGLGE